MLFFYNINCIDVYTSGSVNIFAGTGNAGSSDGAPLQCSFNIPHGISVDEKTNTCFITDPGDHRVRALKFI